MLISLIGLVMLIGGLASAKILWRGWIRSELTKRGLPVSEWRRSGQPMIEDAITLLEHRHADPSVLKLVWGFALSIAIGLLGALVGLAGWLTGL